MHDYARHLIASTAAQVLPCNGSSTRAAIAKQFLPYCLSPSDHDSERVILLNREYKPLGWPTRKSGFVDYRCVMFDSMWIDIDYSTLLLMPSEKSERGVFFYIYGHGSGDAPWKSDDAANLYLHRLKILLETSQITREGCSP